MDVLWETKKLKMWKIRSYKKLGLLIKVVLFLCFFLSIYMAHAEDFSGLKNGDYLENCLIRKERVLIKDKKGNVKGYLQKSIIDSRKTVLYDNDGDSVGYLQEDVIDSRKTRFFGPGLSSQKSKNGKDNNHKANGYLQKSLIDSRKTILYDKNGNQKGYFQRDVL